MDKQAIREEMLKKRDQISIEEHKYMDDLIFNTLKKYINSQTHIGVFLSFSSEINTLPFITFLLEKGIKVSSSKMINHDLEFYQLESIYDIEIGKYNIPIPSSSYITKKEEINTMIVPILAFDENRNRLGYGKGYYDRYLSKFQGQKIGIAYDFQRVPFLQKENHDIALDMIITELKTYE